ncbi:hypothetical protein HYDPIDRAFT_29949 [Hydnomerulius pinastri MD-312]|uniref:Rho1 guanine nucleotide exchange factor 1 n=1 Tax=Hydnomerulius pinastri MD-312 TaxID=994086 RepID=A0A0C9VX45_9AGAM|nr:hypothetical protein HYDPIDRAFT_29949 [Hydnomerulius pinastri MD-312]
MQTHRPHPHVAIPPGARPAVNPSSSSAEVYSPYAFELASASDILLNQWDATPTVRYPTNRLGVPPRSRSRTRSAYEPVPPTIAFPEPEIYRSASQRSTVYPNYHRSSRSDSGHPSGHSSGPPEYEVGNNETPPYSPATPGSASSFNLPADDLDLKVNKLTRELSNMTLQSEEGLRRFQNGLLAEKDEEWHHLVPPEAREALGKREVERQSVLFEVFKSERDYVSDLKLIREVFIVPLTSSSPPIIAPAERLQTFVSTVFWNLDQILMHHERMLAALFARQQDQHPLVQSVTDIILETSFQFQVDYESYIKHYPLAEERHRTELNYNKRYQEFTQRCSQDPRVRKRDLITFLSRPVTRLPRLNLMLEHVHKLTETNHPDVEDLPVILSVMSDFLKSTQPGIAAAENKVKFWNLCESLVFNKGEIIELDWYNDNRSLVHAGTLARRSKSEMDWNPWFDLYVALLDNFFLITKEEKRPGDVVKRLVVSRPIPLEYLRLGALDAPPESRKERAEEGSILDSLRGSYRSVYPFTVYHAVEKSTRRYTLYAPSESARKKWCDALVDAKGVDDVRREANQWFVPHAVDDGFFRIPGPRMVRSKKPPSGRVVQAVSFVASGGRSFMAVGCSSGIFVGRRGENYRKILSFGNVKSIIVLQEFNKIIIHHDNYLLAYSLEVLARVAQYQSPPSSLDASLETIAGQDGSVVCCQAGRIGERTIVIYAVKTFLQVTVYTIEACRPSENRMSPRTLQNSSLSFRPFGEPLYVPKDAFSVMPLAKTVAISTERGIVIANPASATKQVIAVVPDFAGAPSSSNTGDLKARCETAKPLGLIRHDASELMVIYDTMGCYITKHGQPARDAMFIRWEIKATSFVNRHPHVLLFSSEFIEIRDIQTGRLEQVIEGVDIRLLLHTPSTRGPLLVAMRGQKDDEDGVSERIVELVETAEIAPATPASGAFAPAEGMWDEWDM